MALWIERTSLLPPPHSMASPVRRPCIQAERRLGTIQSLINATIGCLVEPDYTHTTTQAIAHEAGMWQGAIFRHFPIRQDPLIATAWPCAPTMRSLRPILMRCQSNYIELAKLNTAQPGSRHERLPCQTIHLAPACQLHHVRHALEDLTHVRASRIGFHARSTMFRFPSGYGATRPSPKASPRTPRRQP